MIKACDDASFHPNVSLFTGNERKWCHADDWKWTAYGGSSELSTRDICPHDNLLDIQVSDKLSFYHHHMWSCMLVTSDWIKADRNIRETSCLITTCFFLVLQGRRQSWIHRSWAKTTRLLLWHRTVILHIDIMRLCKMLADGKLNVIMNKW